MRFIFVFLFLLTTFLSSGFCIQEQITTEYPYGMAYDPKEDIGYVSYIAGNPLKQNGNGSVGIIDLVSLGVNERYFLVGLNAPRGMVILKREIYVCDLNEVKVYNLDYMMLVAKIRIGEPGVSLASDICTDGQKFVYVCDMMGNKIVKIDTLEPNFKVKVLYKSLSLNFPSSIIYEDKKLYIGAFKQGVVYEFDIKDRFLKTLIPKTVPNLTGICKVGKDIFVAGGDKQGLVQVYNGKKLVKTYNLEALPGDMFLKEDKIYIPLRYRNKIVYLSVLKKE